MARHHTNGPDPSTVSGVAFAGRAADYPLPCPSNDRSTKVPRKCLEGEPLAIVFDEEPVFLLQPSSVDSVLSQEN